MNWKLLGNSLLVSAVATAAALAFGFIAAIFAAGLGRRVQRLLLGTAIAALALPPFVVTNCWLGLLGETGRWRAWLPLNIYSLPGAAWILALLLWPVTLLAILSSWRRLQPAHLEMDPAVTGWNFCRALLLPLSRPAIIQAAVVTFVLALNNFAVPAILQVKVYPAEMWVRFNTAFDTAGALAVAWPLLLVPLAGIIFFVRRGVAWPYLQSSVGPKLFRQHSGKWFVAAAIATVVVCFVSALLPIASILLSGRTWSGLPGALAAGQSATANSAWLAAGGALAVLFVGVVIHAWIGSPQRPGPTQDHWFSWTTGLLSIPFLLPGVLTGIALIHAFNHPSTEFFYRSAGVVLLAFFIRYFWLGSAAVSHAIQSVDRELVEAGRWLGVDRWQMFRHVYWPQVAPKLAVTWYIVFLLCLWDVESLVLVIPPGIETLSVRIFNLLHYGHNPQVDALCLVLLVLALLPLLAWIFVKEFAAIRSRGALSLFAVCCVPLLTGCNTDFEYGTSLQSRFFGRVQVIGKRGVGVGELNKPRSVAVDARDHLFVVDMTGRVQKFSTNGEFELSWQMPQTDKGRAKGMCRDRDGNVVVLEPHYSRVNHYAPDGKLVAQWGQNGTNSGELAFPRAVAVNSSNQIFVSEYAATERVQRFALRPAGAAGTNAADAPSFLNAFGTMGEGPGQFNRPEGLCVDSQDRLYVADSCNHRIQIFAADGTFLRSYGQPGPGKGQLSYPYDICVDARGFQFVCEFGNSRIQVFDAQDQPIEILGGPGASPGQFSNPWGVALDSAGNLYVADSQNHRVQKFFRR